MRRCYGGGGGSGGGKGKASYSPSLARSLARQLQTQETKEDDDISLGSQIFIAASLLFLSSSFSASRSLSLAPAEINKFAADGGGRSVNNKIGDGSGGKLGRPSVRPV